MRENLRKEIEELEQSGLLRRHAKLKFYDLSPDVQDELVNSVYDSLMQLDKKNKLDHVVNIDSYALAMLKQRRALHYRKQKKGWVEFLFAKDIGIIPAVLSHLKPKKLGKRKLIFHFQKKNDYTDILTICQSINMLPIDERRGGVLFESGDEPIGPDGPSIIEVTADSKDQSGLKETKKKFKDMSLKEKIKHGLNKIKSFEKRFDLEKILFFGNDDPNNNNGIGGGIGDMCRELIASVLCGEPLTNIAKEMKIPQPTLHHKLDSCYEKARRIII